MSVYREKSGNYCYDFWRDGHRIKESTRQRDKRVARDLEAARKTDLARGEAGIQRRRCPEFRHFVESEFLPWFQATHQSRGQKPIGDTWSALARCSSSFRDGF